MGWKEISPLQVHFLSSYSSNVAWTVISPLQVHFPFIYTYERYASVFIAFFHLYNVLTPLRNSHQIFLVLSMLDTTCSSTSIVSEVLSHYHLSASAWMSLAFSRNTFSSSCSLSVMCLRISLWKTLLIYQ